MNRTLIIIKPHAVERGVTGSILERFERMGLRIAALKVLTGAPELWERFYPSHESWFRTAGTTTLEHYQRQAVDVQAKFGTTDALEIGRLIKKWLVDHMSSGRAIAAVLEGTEAAAKVRLVVGRTLPNVALPGTIRFDFSSDSPTLANDEKRPVYNIIHAADPEERRDGEAAPAYEIALLFPELTR